MRILLQRCKEVGIDEAFEEKRLKELTRMLLGDGDFRHKDGFVKEHPELLSDATDRVLADSASRQKSEGARQLFESLRTLLRRCNEIGISDAFAEYRTGIPQHTAQEQALVKLVQQLIAAKDNSERRALFSHHPELLTPQAEEVMRRTDDDRVAQKLRPLITDLQGSVTELGRHVAEELALGLVVAKMDRMALIERSLGKGSRLCTSSRTTLLIKVARRDILPEKSRCSVVISTLPPVGLSPRDLRTDPARPCRDVPW